MKEREIELSVCETFPQQKKAKLQNIYETLDLLCSNEFIL